MWRVDTLAPLRKPGASSAPVCTTACRPRRASARRNVTLASRAKEPRFRRGQGNRFAWRGVRDEDGPITGDFDQLRMPAETGFVSSNVIERKGQSNSTPE